MPEIARDPDFLRIYYSGDKEWPGYKVSDKKDSLPLLISEIFRFIPYIGSEYVHFHPKNMPDVKIDRVEIIGIVTDKTVMNKYTSYTVDDSTGVIYVLCLNNAENDDESSTSQDSNDDESSTAEESSDDKFSGSVKKKPNFMPAFGLAPDAPYSYERHIRNLWNYARDQDPLYNEVALYDYVHVIGFCGMTFRNQKLIHELTDDDIKLGRLFFFGINLRRISEAQHNSMMKNLIVNIASERYRKPKA